MKANRNLVRTCLAVRLLALLLLMLTAATQAQLAYTDNGNGTATIAYPSCLSGAGSIPATINGLKVTSIGVSAFYSCTSMTSVTIGTNVTSIGLGAFNRCTSMTNVTMPSSLTNIGPYAFEYCSALANVTIPNNVTTIGTNAFFFCGLTKATIGTGVTSIGYEAFYGCNLTGMYFLGNAPSVGLFAVFSSTFVYRILGTSGWGSYFGGVPTAFWDPGSQLGFTTNNNNITIYKYLGSGGEVDIPGAFGGLVVTRIGTNAFAGCTTLTSVMIPNCVTSIGAGAFSGCTAITNVTIPDSVTNIEPDAFVGCTNLINVTLGNSLSSIGSEAFFGCASLTTITFPSSVKTIGDFVLYECTSMKAIYFQGNAPSLESYNAFSGDNNATVYILPGTAGWNYFSLITGISTVLWNPQAQTISANFGVRTNRFGFNITGTSGLTLVVEGSTSLVNSIWFPVATNTLINGTSYFSDPQWTNYPGRFYRLRSP